MKFPPEVPQSRKHSRYVIFRLWLNNTSERSEKFRIHKVELPGFPSDKPSKYYMFLLHLFASANM